MNVYYYIKSCEMSKRLQKITLVCNTEMLVQKKPFKITFILVENRLLSPHIMSTRAMVIPRTGDASRDFVGDICSVQISQNRV
jgi:hypothetical protein